MKRTGFLLVLAFACSLAVLAQEKFWEGKAPENWSRKDCERLLTDSPWARGWAPERATVVTGGGRRASYMTGPRVVYRVQLWSALQIRQAMVRYAELDPNYKSLPEDARKAQDAEAARFVSAQFPDTVVVQVLYWKKDPKWAEFWQGQSVGTLKTMVHLVGPRGQAAPVYFTAPTHDKPEMQFVFPRFVEGHPLLESGDDSLTLRMDLPPFGPFLQQVVSVRFEPKDMLAGGKLVY